MSKLQQLREAILAADPAVESDQLFTFLRDGKVVDTAAGIRYEATATVVITDWSREVHPITWALVQWVRTHEGTNRYETLQFEVDIIGNSTVDVKFELPFSETVVFDGTEHAACAAPVPDPELLPLR